MRAAKVAKNGVKNMGFGEDVQTTLDSNSPFDLYCFNVCKRNSDRDERTWGTNVWKYVYAIRVPVHRLAVSNECRVY